MYADVYRFQFEPTVPLTDAEETLQLALVAAEGLVGESRVRLDAAYAIDEPKRQIRVDGTTAVGDAVVRMFGGFLAREFGHDAFRVERERPQAA